MHVTDEASSSFEPQSDNVERALGLESEDFRFQPYILPATVI